MTETENKRLIPRVNIRGISPALWKEAKRVAKSQGRPIGRWLNQAIVNYLDEEKER